MDWGDWNLFLRRLEEGLSETSSEHTSETGSPRDEFSEPEAYESMLEESRAVLGHQIEFLNQMDDAALRTARTSVIVIGIVVSAASVGPENLNHDGSRVPLAVAALGILSLIGSIVFGVHTFRRSDATLGAGPDFTREVRTERYSRIEWYDLLLQGYDEWHEEMREELAENSRFLAAVQALMLLGVLLLACAVALSITSL